MYEINIIIIGRWQGSTARFVAWLQQPGVDRGCYASLRRSPGRCGCEICRQHSQRVCDIACYHCVMRCKHLYVQFRPLGTVRVWNCSRYGGYLFVRESVRTPTLFITVIGPPRWLPLISCNLWDDFTGHTLYAFREESWRLRPIENVRYSNAVDLYN